MNQTSVSKDGIIYEMMTYRKYKLKMTKLINEISNALYMNLKLGEKTINCQKMIWG